MSAKKYCSGKIPATIWLVTAWAGTLVSSTTRLIMFHEEVDKHFWGGLTRVFFANLLFTIPIFLVQAHFVCQAIQKNKKSAMNVLLSILIVGWIILFLFRYWINHSRGFAEVNFTEENTISMANFFALAFTWILISIFTLPKK